MDSGQQTVPIEVSYARVFYKHLLRTVGLALAAFAVAGSTAVVISFTGGGVDPAYAIVSFLAWGMLAAALVIGLRTPPF